MIRQSVGGLAQRSCVFIKDAREARSWAGLIVAWSTRKTTHHFLLGTPRDEYSLVESPLSEYRPCQVRTAMRRHFGSRAAGFCARHDDFRTLSARGTFQSFRARFKLSSCAGISLGSVTG